MEARLERKREREREREREIHSKGLKGQLRQQYLALIYYNHGNANIAFIFFYIWLVSITLLHVHSYCIFYQGLESALSTVVILRKKKQKKKTKQKHIHVHALKKINH